MGSLTDRLRQRLAGRLPGVDAQTRMAPRPLPGAEAQPDRSALRAAAALLLVYPHDGTWHVPLTVRGSSLRHHTGQVSLPGGRVDAGESIEAAAVREAHEEIGVAPAEVEILGRLSPVPVYVSGNLLHPVVGAATRRPDFHLHEHEVERLIELPVAQLRSPQTVQWETRERTRPPYGVMEVPFFELEGARCWGATAMVLAEFLAVLGDEGPDAGW